MESKALNKKAGARTKRNQISYPPSWEKRLKWLADPDRKGRCVSEIIREYIERGLKEDEQFYLFMQAAGGTPDEPAT